MTWRGWSPAPLLVVLHSHFAPPPYPSILIMSHFLFWHANCLKNMLHFHIRKQGHIQKTHITGLPCKPCFDPCSVFFAQRGLFFCFYLILATVECTMKFIPFYFKSKKSNFGIKLSCLDTATRCFSVKALLIFFYSCAKVFLFFTVIQSDVKIIIFVCSLCL